MTISHLLESFEARIGTNREVSLSEDNLEEQKLESFEGGYKAGWEEAAKAQSNEAGRISSDFAQNLQELAFTYNEAYGHILKSLHPLLKQIVDAVLPEIARHSFGPQIREQLGQMATELGRQDVEVVVAPVNTGPVSEMLKGDFGFSIKVVEETSLGEGQAYLRFGEAERQINQDEVLAGVSAALDGFFHEIEQNLKKEA